jgi:antitoxin component HigA of HigAB toxin-antitoxin module
MKYITEAEYNIGIAYIDKHFDEIRPIGSPEGDYFEMIMYAVMDYEETHYDIAD